MRYFLLIVAVVMGQSVLSAEKKPLITDPSLEKAVRWWLKKPTGQLTEADLVKVFELQLTETQITDAGLKEVAKLQNLQWLDLEGTKVTKAGVAELKKALPKCYVDINWPRPPNFCEYQLGTSKRVRPVSKRFWHWHDSGYRLPPLVSVYF